LRAKQSKGEYRLTYKDISEYASLAIRGQEGEFGWEHLSKTADFCFEEVGKIADENLSERIHAYNSTGFALLLVGNQVNEARKFDDAIKLFRTGLEGLSRAKHREDWLRLQINRASALKSWGKLDNDVSRLREAQSLYDSIAEVATGEGDQFWQSEALKAIDEIREYLLHTPRV
jgi:tetratricopeptide (TPR) repeat protein